jgi:murein DD-endopeptidase MepM/ murein hydrolase activator NlpD
MPSVRVILRAVSVVRPSQLALGALLVLAAGLLWSSERRAAERRQEVDWLQQRLADKRSLVWRQRREMAEVAGAVERLARTTSAVRERASQARRLAHMEETRDVGFDALLVKATLDDGNSILSEDGARALERLALLDGEAAAVGDSLTVLTTLLRNRPDESRWAQPSIWPVRGLVTSPFGRRVDPYGVGGEMHAGIDISARYMACPSPRAATAVVFAGRDSGYGGLVIVDHGNKLDTLYAHLSGIYVREGQSVRKGQPLGAVGASGRATGTHLHYEVRLRGNPVDPRRYLVN